MTSHLTISVELIAFMKWVLQYKQAALNTFLKEVLDPELRAELEEIMHNPVDVSNDELYSIVNNFLGHVEHHIVTQLSDRSQAAAHQHHEPSVVDSAALYRSLTPQEQAQLNQAFDDDVIVQGMHQAATALSKEGKDLHVDHSEQVKKHVLMRSLLNSWSPVSEDEVN